MNIRKQKKKVKKFLKNEGFMPINISKKSFVKKTNYYALDLSPTSRYTFFKNTVLFMYHEFQIQGGEVIECHDEYTEGYKLKFHKRKVFSHFIGSKNKNDCNLPF